MSIGIIICIIIVIYYLKVKVKSMNIDKIITGNIILNGKSKQIYKSLEYKSSFNIDSLITAMMLENKEFDKKYNNSLKKIKVNNNIFKLQKSYFSYAINNAIEYRILELLNDYAYLDDEDIRTIDLNNAPKSILNNIFVMTLAKDYKERDVFHNNRSEIMKDAELFSIIDDKGYIYNKLSISIPKDAILITKGDSLIIKSKFFKITIEWGIDDISSPLSDMEFYNFFAIDYKISEDDIQISYYIELKVEYSLLSMFSKKTNKYYLWIEYLINQIIEDFDFNECLKRNNWELIKNISRIIKK